MPWQCCPEFDKILVIDDYQYPSNRFYTWCDPKPGITKRDTIAVRTPATKDFGEELILCPSFFEFGLIDKDHGSAGRQWTGGPQISCDTVGKFLDIKMRTMGHCLIHEYTHLDCLVKPVVGAAVVDHAFEEDDTRQLDKKLAKVNAESYAWFATELLWSFMCDRDFRFVP